MSQEIQLSLTPPSQSTQALAQQASSWGAPVSTALSQGSQLPKTPLQSMHGHLRGRYLLAGVLAAIFAVVGGAAGFLIVHQGWTSIGLIEIKPVIATRNADTIIPLYQQYITTVVATLKSERVMREAMENPELKAHRPLPPEAYLADWNKNLIAKLAPNSYIISVTYTDEHSDGKVVAPLVVKAVLNAYGNLYGDEQRSGAERKIESWKGQTNFLEQQSQRYRELIDQRLQNIGENPQMVLDERWKEHIALQQRIHELSEELHREQDQVKIAQQQADSAAAYSVEDLARVDPPMEEMYKIRTLLELDLQEYEKRLGTANPATKAAREKLLVRNDQINKYRDELRAKYFIMPRPDGNGNFLVPRDLSSKVASLQRMQELEAAQTQVLDDLGRRSIEVTSLRNKLAKSDDDLAIANKMISNLQSELEMAETYKVIDNGGLAVSANEKRMAFGALGLLMGAGLPVALLLFSSQMNPRYRFSDETTGELAQGLTLLGILPDLPDRLSDPEQASIAAHCVHQIRTMLQINTGSGADDRRVFAITSAAPGDGKTSLTLALGLSYAACGSRTLLIDCDLIGAGLTTRMNIGSEEGVLEAISHRSLLEYVRTTDITDVSILPVGSGQQLHASTLSPAALRRLIEEGRRHFDTILIDTGPVLGSIEASLVAGAADAVVLAVSRGQQRPLVEKTIQHLKNIKATLAGVVFNRARNSDFDRSISGLSLRSSGDGSGNGQNGKMGPVARAVHSAFKPAGEEESSAA